MPVTARLNYLRIAPRKVRLVADLIRGKSARQAEYLLQTVVKRGSPPLAKLLKSALASAKQILGQESDELFISKITVDEGPKFKRWRARARGRAAPIQKKTSHILLVLDVKKGLTEKAALFDMTVQGAREEKAARIEKRTKAVSSPRQKPERDAMKGRGGKIAQRIFRRKAF